MLFKISTDVALSRRQPGRSGMPVQLAAQVSAELLIEEQLAPEVEEERQTERPPRMSAAFSEEPEGELASKI